jgi:tetratricopeptide (TPR) repeat protein
VASAAANLQDGHALELVGDWPAAAEIYSSLINSSDLETACLASIRLARCLLETGKRGEIDAAEEHLAAARKDVMTLGDPVIRGELLLQQGRFDDLAGHLKRALASYVEGRQVLKDAGADLTEAELVLASAERRRGEFNRALARLKAIPVDQLPARLRADYDDELGAVLIARGETGKAIEVLEAALSLDESTATPYAGGRSRLLLAEACMRIGAHERAKDLIDTTIETYKHAHADAGLSEAYAALGLWYENREDFVAASHYYQESLDLDKSSDDLVGQVRAKRRLARTYRNRGASSRAEELLEEAKELLPPDDDVERAALYQEEAHLALTGSAPNYERAIFLFGEALKIAQEDGDEWTTGIAKRNLARAHREDDDLETARDLLLDAKVALAERGDLQELGDLLDDLGEVLLEMDEYDEAEHHLEESFELDERLGRIGSKGRSLLLLGKVASRKGEREESGRYYRDALDLYRKAQHEVGQADSYVQIGEWHLEQGQLDDALRSFREGLEIDTRLNRPLAKVRAKRQLSETYRQRGNLERAEEYLRDAERDLGNIDDPNERAELDRQEGRLELSHGRYAAAYERLRMAYRVFESSRNPVDAATCQRLMALAAAYEARWGEALELLKQAKQVLTQRGDIPELDELLDDLGTVYLLGGRPDAAAAAFRESLELGDRVGWRRGKGRSLLLLAAIAQAEGEFQTARAHITNALKEYRDGLDEVGQAAGELALGDWYVADRNPERNLTHAGVAYKSARRLYQQHRDRRGAARCYRKLAYVYLQNHEYQRADEALQDALAEMKGIDDLRESAPLQLELGRLAAARSDDRDDGQALIHLYDALEGFNRLGDIDGRRATYQLLAGVHQARNEMAQALECIREMGAERAAMYNVLVKDLHSTVATASYPSFAAGQYRDAITDAFTELEHEFRKRVHGLERAPTTTAGVSEVIAFWTRCPETEKPTFAKSSSLDRFADFCIGAFDLLRNPAVHDPAEQSPADAFAALSVAHWIARTLEMLPEIRDSPGERPGL